MPAEMVTIYERFREEQARAEALKEALHAARSALADVTLVGITIEPGEHGKEVTMRQIACRGIGAANEALVLEATHAG